MIKARPAVPVLHVAAAVESRGRTESGGREERGCISAASRLHLGHVSAAPHEGGGRRLAHLKVFASESLPVGSCGSGGGGGGAPHGGCKPRRVLASSRGVPLPCGCSEARGCGLRIYGHRTEQVGRLARPVAGRLADEAPVLLPRLRAARGSGTASGRWAGDGEGLGKEGLGQRPAATLLGAPPASPYRGRLPPSPPLCEATPLPPPLSLWYSPAGSARRCLPR